MNLEKLEEKIGIKFKNKDLLRNAFVHRSYLNEHPDFDLPSNERLEYLGDAVLELLASEYLFKNYPQSPEGDLTNFRAAIVRTESLAQEAKQLNLGSYLLLSRGEEREGGRERDPILANTFEALIGTVYLEKGLEIARDFLLKKLFYKAEEIIRNHRYRDPKSTLQEIAQEELGITPSYKVLSQWGPDHARQFKMGAYLRNRLVGKGVGSSKQEGEESAAKDALKKWK